MNEIGSRLRWCLWLLAGSLIASMLAACGQPSSAPGTGTPALSPTIAGSMPAVPTPAAATITAAALAPTFAAEATAPLTAASPTKKPAVTSPSVATARATLAQPEETAGAWPTAEPPTASPVPTTPPPAPTVTPPRSTPADIAGPEVLFFHVAPTTTLNLGDRLALSWQAVGEQAELCPISGQGPVELHCQDVPLTGNSQFVTDQEAMAYTGFGLRVSAGGASTWSTVNVHLQCQNLRPWFFDHPPPSCPSDVALRSDAAGQYFEGGFMIWVEDPDDFYVFYRGEDEWGFQTFDWISDIRLKPGASEANRAAEQPPPGLYEPVSGFGLVWRGEIEGASPDVRPRLGWATEPEFGFDTAYQCMTPQHPRYWNCFLLGPRGEILYLHPDSTAQVRFLWEEW